MLTMTREPDMPADSLLEDFHALDAGTPEGFRAELIDGEIVVTPPPDGNHRRIIGRIVKQVIRESGKEMDFDGHRGLIVSSRGLAVSGHVIPDITFAPAEMDLFRDAPSWMRPTGVVMVVEVTSSQARADREAKRHAYAAAQIPLYLLVDRRAQRVSLFSGPVRDEYQTLSAVPFGGSIELPEPLCFKLETTDFTG
jgi:Uma2 family endonuclease